METEQPRVPIPSTSLSKSKPNKELEAITNRVNYILRRHRKIKDKQIKVQATTTMPSEVGKFSNFGGSGEREAGVGLGRGLGRGLGSVHVRDQGIETKKERKSRRLSEEKSKELKEVKMKKSKQRRDECLTNHKLIQQQKQQQFYGNRVKRLKILKSHRAAKENLDCFWQTKREMLKTEREIKKIPQKISQLKIGELKTRILKAEVDSLNKFQELICHQEQLANKIKSKLNII